MTITLNPREYDADTALWCARFASCAYLGAADGSQQAAEWGLRRYQHFHLLGSSGCILGTDNFCVLAYAGTDPKSLRDLVTDVSIGLTSGPFHTGDRVHRGFDSYVDRTWRSVRTDLISFLSGRQQLFITGHSLGADAAVIARTKLRDLYVSGVYLFGCPCPGNAEFSRQFDLQCDRVYSHTNHNDFSRWVPFFNWLIGRYHHVARRSWYYFDRFGKRHKNPSLAWVLWDKYCGAPGLLNFVGDSIGDHSIDSFIDDCEGAVAKC